MYQGQSSSSSVLLVFTIKASWEVFDYCSPSLFISDAAQGTYQHTSQQFAPENNLPISLLKLIGEKSGSSANQGSAQHLYSNYKK